MITYLSLVVFTFLCPFIVVHYKKNLSFQKHYKTALFTSGVVAIPFLIWDYFFTTWGVWGFNPEYLIGLTLFNLPIEEILFFIAIPFAVLFIYDLVKEFFSLKIKNITVIDNSLQKLFLISALVIILLGITYQLLYTISAGVILVIILLIGIKYLSPKTRLLIALAYFYSLIGFYSINGILTGGLDFISGDPVVWYNEAQKIPFRVGSIPIEDFVYSYLLLFTNVLLYEFLLKKK